MFTTSTENKLQRIKRCSMSEAEKDFFRAHKLPKEGDLWIRLLSDWCGVAFRVIRVTPEKISCNCVVTGWRRYYYPEKFLSGVYGFIPKDLHEEWIERSKKAYEVIEREVKPYHRQVYRAKRKTQRAIKLPKMKSPYCPVTGRLLPAQLN